MFKLKSSVLLLAIVAMITLCSTRTQAQKSGDTERINIDSLVTDSATVADGVKLVAVISNGPGKENTTAWVVAILFAGLAVYKHIRSAEHKAVATVANAKLEALQTPAVMNAEQFASKTTAEQQFKDGTHPAMPKNNPPAPPDVTSEADRVKKKAAAAKQSRANKIPKRSDGTVDLENM